MGYCGLVCCALSIFVRGVVLFIAGVCCLLFVVCCGLLRVVV